jgi:hypothetical protein
MHGQHQGDNPRPADGAPQEEYHYHTDKEHGERMSHGPRVALRESWRYKVT